MRQELRNLIEMWIVVFCAAAFSTLAVLAIIILVKLLAR